MFVFAALGHFERKGLPLLLEAFSRAKSASAKLLVIGGTEDLVATYRGRASDLGLSKRVIFAGMQSDVRPYLWAADAFAFASTYETFSLTAFEAAGASLPLITPRLHGIEEIVKNGETGYIVERTVDAFVSAIDRFSALALAQRAEMGRCARLAALNYNQERFVNNWRRIYDDLAARRRPNNFSEPVGECPQTLA